ncbi:hypothetical protein ACGF0D_05420 [Kitasatospora sp. NPDC048298]|uniref:hypothetical protein n=1 Tax=Kitasatospora sp. NPDC048298 TaxID=3364049 RepID=UPI00371CE6CE
MLDKEEHWNAVLAAILVSRRVGPAHVKLVGDLVSVTAQLDMAAAQGRRPGCVLDDLIEYDEEMGPLEEDCRAAWQELEAAPDKEQRNSELEKLRAALEAAVEGVANFARRRGVAVEFHRFGDPQVQA